MAEQVATRSKDPSTKVGCVISTEDKVVVATGYNGIPRDVLDKPERMERPAKYLWTSHAEENAVAMAARVGSRLRGGHAFVTHMPCCRCARMLIQAGISTVYCGDGTTSMPLEEFDVATQMFREAGVLVVLTKQKEEV
jgi:dCMP deaminase